MVSISRSVSSLTSSSRETRFGNDTWRRRGAVSRDSAPVRGGAAAATARVSAGTAEGPSPPEASNARPPLPPALLLRVGQPPAAVLLRDGHDVPHHSRAPRPAPVGQPRSIVARPMPGPRRCPQRPTGCSRPRRLPEHQREAPRGVVVPDLLDEKGRRGPRRAAHRRRANRRRVPGFFRFFRAFFAIARSAAASSRDCRIAGSSSAPSVNASIPQTHSLTSDTGTN